MEPMSDHIQDVLEQGFVSDVPLQATPLGAGQTLNMALDTLLVPVEVIMSFISSNVDELAIMIYEGESYTGGAAIEPVSVNRINPQDECYTVKAGVTATPVSTPIENITFFSKSEGVKSKDVISNFIFKPSSTYLMTLKNKTNQDGDISGKFTLSCRADLGAIMNPGIQVNGHFIRILTAKGVFTPDIEADKVKAVERGKNNQPGKVIVESANGGISVFKTFVDPIDIMTEVTRATPNS